MARCSTNQGIQGSRARPASLPWDARGGMLEVQTATVPPPGSKVQAPGADCAGRGKADKERGRGRGDRKKRPLAGAWSDHR